MNRLPMTIKSIKNGSPILDFVDEYTSDSFKVLLVEYAFMPD